jgi:hypothetical protein
MSQDRAQESISSTNPESLCRFALALPEKEGPLTLGIFSPEGGLVRLLYRDASIETIPAGLNGLLISWDGKDDSGLPVPEGTYDALGLVHGKLTASLPRFSQRMAGMQDSRLQTGPKVSEATNDSAPFATPFDTALPAFHPFRSNRIIVMAARDALFENEKRPQLTISARLMDKGVLVTAAGLPLFSLALDEYSQSTNSRVELHRLSSPGEAELLLISPEGTTSIILSGLDQLVPLHAGSLPMPPGSN